MGYNRKLPPECHLPREHWNKKHGRLRKAKIAYETKEEAEEFLAKYRLKGFTVYLCHYCHKYHIGHSNKSLNV